LGRLLPMGSFGQAAPLVMFAAILAFALAGPIVDLVVRKRVHAAYAWGVGAIVLSNLLIAPLAFSPPALALLKLVRGH
jgi:hypothetical protein